MTQSYSGGCACGAIRYETSQDPIAELHCQCRQCQQRSGTGHSSYLAFGQRSKLTITGAASEWQVAGDSGNLKVHAFCPNCGTPVYVTFIAMPEMIAVHAASLDEPGRFQPQFVTYVARGQSWDRLDPALTRFEGMPEG